MRISWPILVENGCISYPFIFNAHTERDPVRNSPDRQNSHSIYRPIITRLHTMYHAVIKQEINNSGENCSSSSEDGTMSTNDFVTSCDME